MNGYSALFLKTVPWLAAVAFAWGSLNMQVNSLKTDLDRISNNIEFLMKWHIGPPPP